MNILIILTLLFSTSVFAKRDAENNIRKVCRPTLAQCAKDRMSLSILSAKYNDIYFDLNKCQASAGRFCFGGRLSILYNAKPTQRINMIVDEDTCSTVARAANDASGRFVNCSLRCSFYRKSRDGGWGDVLLVYLFNKKRGTKPYNLKGKCRIK